MFVVSMCDVRGVKSHLPANGTLIDPEKLRELSQRNFFDRHPTRLCLSVTILLQDLTMLHLQSRKKGACSCKDTCCQHLFVRAILIEAAGQITCSSCSQVKFHSCPGRCRMQARNHFIRKLCFVLFVCVCFLRE